MDMTCAELVHCVLAIYHTPSGYFVRTLKVRYYASVLLYSGLRLNFATEHNPRPSKLIDPIELISSLDIAPASVSALSSLNPITDQQLVSTVSLYKYR